MLKRDLHSLDLIWGNHWMFSQVPLVVYNKLLLKSCIYTSSGQFCGVEVNLPGCPQVLVWIAELLLLYANWTFWVSFMQQKFVPRVCPWCQWSKLLSPTEVRYTAVPQPIQHFPQHPFYSFCRAFCCSDWAEKKGGTMVAKSLCLPRYCSMVVP